MLHIHKPQICPSHRCSEAPNAHTQPLHLERSVKGLCSTRPSTRYVTHMVVSLQYALVPILSAEKVLEVFHCAEAQAFLTGTFPSIFDLF